MTELSDATTQDATKTQQAADPATPVETLRTLAYSDDTTTRAAIASNPNTPLDTLLWMAKDYPHEFLHNPALALLLLEQPKLPERLQSLVPSLMRCEEVPLALLRALANAATPATGLYVVDLIEMHVQVFGELPPAFEQDKRIEKMIWSGLIEARNVPVALMKLYTLPDFFAPWLLVLLAEAAHWDWTQRDIHRIRVGLALCPDTPVSILCDLATRKYKGWREIRKRLALHPHMPPDILAMLANNCAGSTDRALAYNPHTPPPTLEKLAISSEATVRRAAARNVHTSSAMLEKLAHDREEIVRVAVATQRYTPAATLYLLAQDESPQVRMAVARNYHAPDNARDLLQRDADPKVRAALIRRKPHLPLLSPLLARADAGDMEAILALACHPYAPPDRLDLGYYESFDAIRLAIASNPRTPAAVLERLARAYDDGERTYT
ncbi:MAG: hypothetical protein ABI068_13495, partial [Ktedonobacterales bacterium]